MVHLRRARPGGVRATVLDPDVARASANRAGVGKTLLGSLGERRRDRGLFLDENTLGQDRRMKGGCLIIDLPGGYGGGV